jgi:hypothetical protein
MKWETPLFEEPVKDYGLIQISVARFGAFSRIVSTGKRVHAQTIFSGLFGRDVPQNVMPVLTITGHIGGLSLNDNSTISGNIVLNHGQIYLNGSTKPSSNFQTCLTTRESPSVPFDSLYMENLVKSLSVIDSVILSTAKYRTNGSVEITSDNDSLFGPDTIAVSGDCTIKGVKLGRKIIAVSGTVHILGAAKLNETQVFGKKIIVDDCTTRQCLLYCPQQILLVNGFHNSQFFSKDSIFISQKARFGNMNLIVNYRDTVGKTAIAGGIVIESGARVKGTIISVLSESARKKTPGISIKIRDKSEIDGNIVTDHDMDMSNVKITGHVWCKAIVVSKDAGLYTNTLFNTNISRSDRKLSFPLCGELPAEIVFEKAEVR